MKKMMSLLLAILLVFSLASCGGSPTSSNPSTADTPKPADAPKPDDRVEITAALQTVPNSLDPVSEDLYSTLTIGHHIYDYLVGFDLDFNWIPSVAKSWKQVDDTHWEFEINTDLRFQNGEQLKMEDVEFSITRLKNVPKVADAASAVKSVSSKDNILTIELTEANNAYIPRILAICVIVNKAYVEANGDTAIYTAPIGTGPYKVTEYTPGNSLTIETWDGYALEKPDIDVIHFIGIAESASLYIAVETGQAQYAGFVSALEVENAEANSELAYMSSDSNNIQNIGMNCSRAPFDNVNVRRAMAYCIDRAAWGMLKGGRTTVDSILAVGFNEYSVSDKLPEFNPERAKELLEAEGYNESNPLEFTIIAFRMDPGVELFQSTLKTIGVHAEISLLEFSVYLEKEGRGDFDMLYTAVDNPAGTPLQDLQRFDTAFFGTRDITFYSNDEYQEIIKEARLTKDPERLKELFKEANDIISDEVPMVPIFLFPLLSVFDKDLTGVTVRADMVISFRDATYNG